MANLVVTPFPTTALATVPDFDLEVSLSYPTQGPIFRSIAGNVRWDGLSITRGREDELDAFQPATFASTLGDLARTLDPDNAAGPFYGKLNPDTRIRFLERWPKATGTTYVRFDGYLDEFVASYPDANQDAIVSVKATDGFKALALKKLNGSWCESEVVKDRPDHWWKLDESTGAAVAIDSGYGTTKAHGTYTNGPTLGSTALVTYDGGRTAVAFDGTDDHVLLDAATPLPTGAAFSITGWFKHASVSTRTDTIMVLGSASATSSSPGVFIYIMGSSEVGPGFLRVNNFTNGGTSATGSASRVDDDLIHHVAYTSTGSLESVYIDGVLANTTARATVALSGNIASAIARQQFGTPGAFDTYYTGSLQEFAVFPVALSAARVAAHYEAGKHAFSGDTTGQRATRVLDYIGLPNADRSVATSNAVLGAHELPTGPALDYLRSLAETELCHAYMGIDGSLSSDHTFKYVHRGRSAQLSASRSRTSQATFGSGPGELRFAEIVVAPNSSVRLYNEVSISSQGNTTQTVSVDAATAEKRFPRTLEKSLLYATDSDMLQAAQFLLSRYKNPQYKINKLVILPQRDPTNLYPVVLAAEIGNRYTFRVRHPANASYVEKDLVLQGYTESLNADGLHQFVWQVSEIEAIKYFLLDSSLLDGPDLLSP